MIPTSQTLLRWAAIFMPRDRSSWLTAMKTELEQISNPAERHSFALGCFKAALLEGARSRKGLSHIARAGGASFLFVFSAMGLFWASQIGTEPETFATSKIITGLCLFYICGAALLVTSLKGFKIYAGTGFGVAVSGWAYCRFARPSYEYVSNEFLTAINFEAAGLMACLLLVTVYLDWLYTPGVHDA